MAPLEFTRPSPRSESASSTLRHWRSRCGRYRVTESISRFGLGRVWYAALADAWGWANLKAMERFPWFRTRKAAVRACEQHRRRRQHS